MSEVVAVCACVPVGWLIVLAVVALLVFGAFVLRFGVLVCYDQAGPSVKIRVGPKYIPVYPVEKDPDKEAEQARKRAAKEKKRKARAEKKAAQKAAREAGKPPTVPGKRSVGGILDLVWDLLPLVGETAGKFRRKLRIDDLTLDLTWAEEDPADTGIHYGQGWAVLEALLAFLEANFIIKHRQVALYPDFLAEESRLYVRAGLSLTLAQILSIAVPAGIQGIKVLWRHRRTIKPARQPAEALEQKGEGKYGTSSCQ